MRTTICKAKKQLNKILFLSFLLFITLSTIAQTQIGLDIDGEVGGDQSGWSVSMPDANTVAIGARLNDGNGSNAGHVRIYTWNGSVWAQKGADIDGEAAGDISGYSVSMPDANTVAIGARGNNGNGTTAGHVRIYTWNGSAWTQKGADIDGEAGGTIAGGDFSGTSVSMPDANTVAIGANGNDGSGNDAGHVRIYTWNGSAWTQKGLDIDGEAAGDRSGISVSMPDANTVAIGATGNDGNGTSAGHVRIYTWNGSAWTQKGIDIDGEATSDLSGTSVSMPDANTVAIGANLNDGSGNDAGHVRIYIWNGSAWTQKGADIDGEAAGDRSGISVSMPDANTVAIGANLNDGSGLDGGHTRIYTWNGTAWVQKGIDIDGEAGGDQSGYSVSMPDANTVAIGAINNDGSFNDAGHVRVYALCTPTTGTDTRTECNTFTWIDNNTYTASNNTATFNIANGAANGCDSLVTLDLTIINSATGTDVQTACNTFTWIDNNTYTANNNTATFNIVGGAANGCDSLVTLDLTIINSATGTDVQTACNTFTWIDNNTYTASNNTATFNIVGGAANGCDSLVTLDLTIINSATGTDVQTACNTFTWIDNNTYTSSNNTATFNIVNGAANGCDSLVTLDLTIINSATGTDVQTACNTFTWIDNNTYTASNNTATHTIVGGAANGCDSIVTLNLTINNPTAGTDVQTACSSYTWIDNNTYTASNNTATHTILGGAANGCDSVVTLNLTITTVDNTTTLNTNTISANQNGATYRWLDCDNGNAVISGETAQSFTPTATGNYAAEITFNGCIDTSACTNVIITSINELASAGINIYPNPINDKIVIDLANSNQHTEIAVYGVDGKLVYNNTTINSNKLVIDATTWSKGLYFVNITTDKNNNTLKMIKQ